MENGNISSSDDESLMPSIEIMEQPKQRGYRFRYGCEGKTAGCLPGERSTSNKKTTPAIRLKNIPAGCNSVVVISCVTADDVHRPHPHRLVGKNCDKGVCTLNIKRTSTVLLQHIGIQCVKKKDTRESLLQREQIKVNPFSEVYYDDDYGYDMKRVQLAIQAFIQDSRTGQHVPLPPVLTNIVYDQKSENELVICRMDKSSSQVKGGEEVFLLCEKVNKDDIQLQFTEEASKWESWADFNPNDVHKQFAIVFKTPPFKDQDIQKPRSVQIRLFRPSDDCYSEPKEFIYTPNDPDPFGVQRKRKRKSYGTLNLPGPEPNVPLLDAFKGASTSGGNVSGGQIPANILDKLRYLQAKSPRTPPRTPESSGREDDTAMNGSEHSIAETTQAQTSSVQTSSGLEYPSLESSSPNTPRLGDLVPLSTGSFTTNTYNSQIPSIVNQISGTTSHQVAPMPTVLPGSIGVLSQPVMATEDSDPQQMFNSMTTSDGRYSYETYDLESLGENLAMNDMELLDYLGQNPGVLEADNGAKVVPKRRANPNKKVKGKQKKT